MTAPRPGRGIFRWLGIPSLVGTTTLALLSACSSSPPPQTREYVLEGQILALRPEAQEVLIKHGDIQGFMPGMTMPFKVKEPALLDDKRAGDLVKATLVVGDTNAWLASLETIGTAPLAEPAAMPAAAFVAPLAPGDELPQTALTDQSGATFSLDQWRGSAVAITFIYIRCPLPQYCPMLDRRFGETQRAVAADPALAGRARLLSVSFDPEADTPARLSAHAERLGADPAVWRFATAPVDVVERFAAQFGVNVIREADGTITHNMRTVVAGPDGRVVGVHSGADWTPADIVADLRRALAR